MGRSLLITAGLVTWALAGIPLALSIAGGEASAHTAWAVAHVVFGAAFLLATLGEQLPPRTRAAALLVQSIAALVVLSFARSGFEASLLCVVAGQAPLLLPSRTSLVWVLAQTLGMALVVSRTTPLARVWLSLGSYAGFQLFALGAALLAERESVARKELLRANAELLATRELFEDAARAAERVDIARELHDSLGHHLTALSIQLELANKLGPVDAARATEASTQAYDIVRTLLGELRAVVSTMREERPMDLAHALRTLARGVPTLTVHLDVDAASSADPATAHALFRCAQEALTNAARHANAKNLWVTISASEAGIEIVARDDGRGAAVLRAGNGLHGLRERVEALGGHLEIESASVPGFTLRALVRRGHA